MKMKTSLLTLLVLVLVAATAGGDVLNDPTWYCDPAGIAYDAYTQITLDVGDSCNWVTGLVDDVDILPPLKMGEYGQGYAYSLDDYLLTPTIDYAAVIENGNLTLQFSASGLYHTRVSEGDTSSIYALFVGIDVAGKGDKPDKTGPNKALPVPEGDLFLVDDTDADVENNMAKVLTDGGRTVERVGSRAAVVAAIEKASKAAGKKLHVEICGHGLAGNVSTGASEDHVAAEQIDMTSVAAFQKEIDEYVNHITFQSCGVGQGDTGQQFLKILADSIGKAGAWDNTLYVDSTGFYVDNGTKFVTVIPEPATVTLLGLGMLVLARRRRRAA